MVKEEHACGNDKEKNNTFCLPTTLPTTFGTTVGATVYETVRATLQATLGATKHSCLPTSAEAIVHVIMPSEIYLKVNIVV